MQATILKTILAGILLAACSMIFAPSAPAADDPGYAYGMFKINGYALKDPTRGYCGPQCSRPNPALNATHIHSPVFRLPARGDKVDLWETGKTFCRRARQQFGEAWWKTKGMPDCIDGALSNFYTQERAFETLEKLYARAKKENRPDYVFEVFEFADFQPERVKLFVLRFPGSVPAPVPARTASQPQSAPVTATAPSRPITALPSAQPEARPVTSQQELAEIAAQERLNREQAAFAAKQLADNAAAKAAFDKATAEREATIARQQAEARRNEAEYAAAMAKWRADVEACKQGDFSRCAPPQ